ncbi:DUF4198 domain-containing protein [Octadecabacter sp.]|nr:DUF4198 domain-containing protein [Octadecabacter sp.]
MRILAALLTSVAFALPAQSHEFWIEPLDYEINAEATIQGKLVNGQNFDGTEISYLPQRFTRFTVASGLRQANVENRLGARPALDTAPVGEGLNVISYQSRMATIGYAEWEKFLSFAEHKAFGDIETLHDARDLPREGFDEGYWRFAKTLVGVGHGMGDDFRTGLAVEYVALDNPYTDDLSDGLRVQLFVLDEPRAGGQVELFEKAPDGTATITLLQTDADGIATLPVKAGHSYLVDHVHLREPSTDLAAETGIAWETLWAALTFEVPD